MTEEEMYQAITEARARIANLSNNLPKSVSVAALGVMQKAPFVLLATRECLIWRAEELARNALEAFERKDLAVAAMLTRGFYETTALVFHLRKLLETRAGRSSEELHRVLIQASVGSRMWEDFPAPTNILTHMKHVDKFAPGTMHAYEVLSEYAHPNWSGVAGLFKKIDEKNFTAYFGRGQRTQPAEKSIINLMLASLLLFEDSYNEISKGMPEWIAELDKIYPDEPLPVA